VPSKVVEVCFALGLRVMGKQLCLEDDGGGLVNEVFGGEDIKIDILLEKLGDKIYRKKMLMNFVGCTYFFYYMFFFS